MEDSNGTTALQQMVSSCSGALATSIIVTPLDVVKVRMQAQQNGVVRGRCFMHTDGLMDHCLVCLNGNGSGGQWFARPSTSRFNGTFDALLKISRSEGVRSLWSGLPATLVMAVPATICYFTTYDELKYYLQKRLGARHSWIPLVSGGVARAGVVTLVSPIEMVRTKLQSEKLAYSELWGAVGRAIRQDGFLSLYRGWAPTILRDVPFSMIYWFFYEAFKPAVRACFGCRRQNLAVWTLSGSMAGSIAAVATLPFDVVKTQRQVEIGEIELLHSHKKPSATLAIMKRLYEQNGLRALYAGLVPRLAKIVPACAIMIGTYEWSKDYFRQKNYQRLNSQKI